MRIGQLARSAGVTADTIRYYEREGLLPPPARTASGYREYDIRALEDLDFIRKARASGLKLADIREVQQIAAGGQAPCEHVRATVEARLEEVEARLRELRSLRRTLRTTLERLDRLGTLPSGCRCAAIEAAEHA